MAADKQPCDIWKRHDLQCPRWYQAALGVLVDPTDDEDDPPWDIIDMIPVVGRKLKKARTAYNRVKELQDLYRDIQEALDRQREPARSIQSAFVTTTTSTTSTTVPRGRADWQKDAALVGAIVLGAYAWYQARARGRPLTQRAGLIAGVGLIAPFLAGQETEPRTLTLVPAYALRMRQNQLSERKRLEETTGQTDPGDPTATEDPPGGGVDQPVFYLWYDSKIGGRDAEGILKGFVINRIVNQAGLRPIRNWVIVGLTEAEVRATLVRLSQSVFDQFYRQLVKDNTPDPIGGGQEIPGSELEQGNQEQVDESQPVGNRW